MAIVLDSNKENFSHHRKFCWTARSKIIVLVNVSSVGHNLKSIHKNCKNYTFSLFFIDLSNKTSIP